MRVLVIGASGFIGSHVCRTLTEAGHEPVPARAGAWQDALPGAQAAVYLAGTLRDRQGADTDLLDRLHHREPVALLRACEAAGVARLVHVSALTGGASGYARSKHAGEVGLAQHQGRCSVQILQPSMVLGPGGASSRMLDRLARLPWLVLPAAVARCQVQPIRVEDLAGLILRALDAPAGPPLAAVGPTAASVAEWIAARRATRADAPARVWLAPDRLSFGAAALADWVPVTPFGRAALELLAHDSIEPDASECARLAALLGHTPRPVLEGAW